MNAVFPRQSSSFVRQLHMRQGAAMGVLLVMFLGQFLATQEVVHAQQDECTQRFALQTTIDTLVGSVINQETGLRGYLLTTNPLFLAPFDQGRSQYLTTLQDVRHLIQTPPFPATRQVFLQLQNQTEIWYETYALVQISAIQSGHPLVARSESTLARGKFLFDRFRKVEGRFQQILNDEQQAFEQQEILLNERLLLGLAFCSVIVILGAWFTIGSVARDLKRQLAQMKQVVQRLGNGELETRIAPLKHREFHVVGQTLNAMAHALLHQQQELAMRTLVVERANEYWALLNTVKTALLFVSPINEVLVVNQSFTDVFGIEAAQVIKRPLNDLVSRWQVLFADSSALLAFFKGECAQQNTVILTLTSPRVCELELQKQPVWSQDKQYALGCLYMLRDITQERALEQLKTEFISTVSHEFRTALTGIQGFSELICEEANEHLIEIKEFASSINEDALRLTTIVSTLLDFDQMQAGTLTVHSERMDMNALIKESVEQVVHMAPHHHLHLELDATLPLLMGDTERVRQVLKEILTNAAKYAPEGGTILVSSRMEEKSIHVCIQDHGKGIPAEALLHIFEPYSRIHAKRTRYVEGVGLGLTFARQIITMHGGQIWAESRQGEGTQMHILLPC